MAKISETSFANRYGRGMELYTYIGGLNGYDPQKKEVQKDSFRDLLNRINTLNNSVTEKKNLLKVKIEERDKMIKSTQGIVKLSGKVRDLVGATIDGGKSSKTFKQIQTECQKMTSNVRKKSASTEPPAGSTPPDNATKVQRSTAEAGVNAVVQYAKNIAEVIKHIPNYHSAHPDLTIDGFNSKVTAAAQAVQDVHAAYDQYDIAVSSRHDLYEGAMGLKELMTRIHDYIAYEFGKESEEFKNAAKIRY